MKRICTQFALILLLLVGQKLYAQTLTISTTNPIPTPGFGPSDNVSRTNGFTSTNTGTFNDFAPFQTDTIISPLYYYSTAQSAINFVFNCSAAASGVDATPTVLIITQSGDTLSANASEEFKGATTNYYFNFNLATPLPANTIFKIAVIMTLGPKAVNVGTLATNALRTTTEAKVLPVKFTGLSAKKVDNYVTLKWNVSGEINTSGYEVQRSTDGSIFTTIGFVSASNKSSYNFVDSKQFENSYYRIKSTDRNSNSAYSVVVNTQDLQSVVVMKAFPMPVQNLLTVQHSSANDNSKLEILCVDGRMISSVLIATGDQQTRLDFSTMKPGMYVVRFVNNNTIESLKIVKQ